MFLLKKPFTSRGYKPHVARELLGISKEKLRYWKANLDPLPSRSYFTASDLFAYRILQACIQDLRIIPSELRGFDVPCIFEFCRTNNTEKMENSILILNVKNKRTLIVKESEFSDFRNREVCYLYLNELLKEHIIAFMSLGCE